MLLPIHVAAGGLAMILGGLALSVKKGGSVHRRSGLLFVCAMLVMGLSGSILGFLRSPTDTNVFAGLMTAYFVATAVTAVRVESFWTRAINTVALAIACVLAVGGVVGGITLVNTPGLDATRVPFVFKGVMTLVVATVLIAAAAGDVKALRFGVAQGAPRLKRHLWRMCFALFIALGSFFSIRERVATLLPAPFTGGAMRALPIALLFGTVAYWLWRLRRRHKLPLPVRHGSIALATGRK